MVCRYTIKVSKGNFHISVVDVQTPCMFFQSSQSNGRGRVVCRGRSSFILALCSCVLPGLASSGILELAPSVAPSFPRSRKLNYTESESTILRQDWSKGGPTYEVRPSAKRSKEQERQKRTQQYHDARSPKRKSENEYDPDVLASF